ncbi:SMI1/KNR4 family protein [Shewanella sp. SM74]|uniref:SMI1/KNR4 family protein n=1 Tax=Shewanella sp. SM74 TaxID=2912807 RepID=UPI0021D8F7DF|nr:SMI1/KNR4 family protein [Shewanella sp. SM74]MCU8014199.1 SMI1/KNR4 family protein [Shewanella sp. SM74]
MKISELQKERGIELPSDYLEFVAGIDAGEDYCFNEFPDEYPDFEGRCWAFFDEELLCENIEMSGVGNAPAHRQLELYLKCYQEFSNSEFVHSSEGKLPINRVANGFVVAEENGDLLYLDPEDNFSVWIFHHDGSDVKKVSNSMSEWLARTTNA